MTGYQSKKASAEMRWLGPYTGRHADNETVDHIIDLRKKNEAYKAALMEIEDIVFRDESWLAKSINIKIAVEKALK
jgi:hypothetical protein